MRHTRILPRRLPRYRFDSPAPGSPGPRLTAYRPDYLARYVDVDEHEAPPERYQVRIENEGRAAGAIAAILTRHGGARVDSGPTAIYEFPARAGRDAALNAVRSVYGWTSAEPRY